MKTQQHYILRLRQSDPKVISELYDQYGAALYGVILRIVQNRELAEEVMQDAFVKIWRHGQRYESGKGSLFTWMISIARNTALDAVRSAQVKHLRQFQPLEMLLHSPGGQALNPEHLLLREAVMQLEDKYRSVVEMVYFKEYSCPEVAAETGLPLGTVKTRLRSALGTLRAAFLL